MAPIRQHCRKIKDKDGHKRGHCIGTPGNIALAKGTTGKVTVAAEGYGRRRGAIRSGPANYSDVLYQGTKAAVKTIKPKKAPRNPTTGQFEPRRSARSRK